MSSGSANESSMSAAPTGPAASNDRTRTDRRRQLADINNALQGGPAPRSRSSRSNLAGSDAQVLTGASPISPQVFERPELIAQNERGTNGSERGRHSERGRRDQDNAERAPRPRPTSRERSAGRDRGAKEGREYRERKSGAGGPGHGAREHEREPRRSGREPSGMSRELQPTGGRGDPMNTGREGGRDGRHRGDGGGGGRHDDFGRGGGGGGGRPGGPDRRESQRNKGDDRGRKRQSEEGLGGGPSEKRQRR